MIENEYYEEEKRSSAVSEISNQSEGLNEKKDIEIYNQGENEEVDQSASNRQKIRIRRKTGKKHKKKQQQEQEIEEQSDDEIEASESRIEGAQNQNEEDNSETAGRPIQTPGPRLRQKAEVYLDGSFEDYLVREQN